MKMEDFDNWLKNFSFVNITSDGFDELSRRRKVIELFTHNYKYQIVAIEDENGGYLGCQVSNRKYEPGETWFRGRDLPDGKFTKETLEDIKSKIIAHELDVCTSTSYIFHGTSGCCS